MAYTHICTPRLYFVFVCFFGFLKVYFGFLGKVRKTSRKPKTTKTENTEKAILWGTFLAYTHICAPRFVYCCFCFLEFFWFSTTSVGCQCYLLFSSAFVLFAVYDEGWETLLHRGPTHYLAAALEDKATKMLQAVLQDLPACFG